MTPNLAKNSNALPGDRYDDPNHPRNNPAYQPESLKQKKAEASQSDMSEQAGYTTRPDGDHTAKGLDQGANVATNAQDMTEGIHEDVSHGVCSSKARQEYSADRRKTGAGEKETGQGTSIFSKDGAIGKQFTATGNIGQVGEKVGGQYLLAGCGTAQCQQMLISYIRSPFLPGFHRIPIHRTRLSRRSIPATCREERAALSCWPNGPCIIKKINVNNPIRHDKHSFSRVWTLMKCCRIRCFPNLLHPSVPIGMYFPEHLRCGKMSPLSKPSCGVRLH